MSNWLAVNGAIMFLGVPLVMYVAQACLVYFATGRIGMGIAMVGYAAANIGLIMDARGI